ncbi:hypothetical protein OW158_07425 [Xanthomonas fragariae]|nr:hypothetical protein [Xanthomonas fragariae]WIY73529.1 hypothetical protein OW158_07425 [Xanthomonas fragariae]
MRAQIEHAERPILLRIRIAGMHLARIDQGQRLRSDLCTRTSIAIAGHFAIGRTHRTIIGAYAAQNQGMRLLTTWRRSTKGKAGSRQNSCPPWMGTCVSRVDSAFYMAAR